MSSQLQDIIPEPQPADLLEQLARNYQTSGLARLAQRLIIALKVPMHARAGNHQSFGGVSDITNRGTVDRLLLSELAHDDLSLMVRLANNEALYFRREELPAKHNRQRFILIDTSIKMWGTPRMYALATAIAAISNSKTSIRTFAIQGNQYEEIDINSLTGIKATLNQLSPALDSAEALTAFTKAFPLNKLNEYFLITDEQLFYTPSFQYAFANLRNAHGFLVTVNRSGQLQMFQYTGAGRKLLHSVLLDLPELLRAVINRNGLPAFLNEQTAPLYFPFSRANFGPQHAFNEFGLVYITPERQVLFWPNNITGAREIISCIIEGEYHIGYDNMFLIFILVNVRERNRLVLYKINIPTLTTTIIECDHSFKTTDNISISFSDNIFNILLQGQSFYVNPKNGYIRAVKPAAVIGKMPEISPLYYYNNIKKHVNNGYSTYTGIRRVSVRNGLLSIDTREFKVHENKLMLKKSGTSALDTVVSAKGWPETINLPNVEYKLYRFLFNDESEVFFDPRGLLHLRAADNNVPEVTIALLLGKETACWASDGHVCGSKYFTGDNPNSIPVQQFYDRYIQPFINALS